MSTSPLDVHLEDLDHAEKARLFQRLAFDLVHAWPGIEKTPGVQGGDACIVRIRIPVWTLEAYRRLGWDDQRILANFTSLRETDLRYAWLYISANRQEIDTALHEQEVA